MNTSCRLWGACLSIALISSGWAKEETLPDANLKDFKFGPAISGAEVTPELLKDKVVVIENWGVN